MRGHSIDTRSLTRDQWLHLRRQGLGGSDIPAILGIGRKSQVELYLEKLNPVPPPDLDNDYFWYGRAMEPVVAQRFTELTAMETRNVYRMYYHPNHAFMLANVDRMIVTPEGRETPGVLEIKTTDYSQYVEWKDQGIRNDYTAQLYWYMMVLGWRWGYLAVMVHRKLVSPLVEWDEDVAAEIEERAREFWMDHVIPKIPPQPESEADCKALWKSGVKKKVVITVPDITDKARRLRELEAEITTSEAIATAIRMDIQSHLQDAEILTDAAGHEIARWPVRNGYQIFDQTRFKEEQPALYEQYKTKEVAATRTTLKITLEDTHE